MNVRCFCCKNYVKSLRACELGFKSSFIRNIFEKYFSLRKNVVVYRKNCYALIPSRRICIFAWCSHGKSRIKFLEDFYSDNRSTWNLSGSLCRDSQKVWKDLLELHENHSWIFRSLKIKDAVNRIRNKNLLVRFSNEYDGIYHYHSLSHRGIFGFEYPLFFSSSNTIFSFPHF